MALGASINSYQNLGAIKRVELIGGATKWNVLAMPGHDGSIAVPMRRTGGTGLEPAYRPPADCGLVNYLK